MSEPTLEEQGQIIELSIEQAKEQIAMATALEKLKNNQYFKKIFMDHYMDKYAINLVKLKAHPSMQTPEKQLNILNEIDGIGQFDQYMRFIQNQGMNATGALESHEYEKQLILEEERAAVAAKKAAK
jgi:hypothetical protein